MTIIPSHVPPERVVDFDFYNGPEVRHDPYLGLSRLHDGPDIFYTPRNEGHWVVTRARYAREIMEDSSRFSADLHYNPRMDENGPRLIPAQVDPPIHTKYRTLINRPLSPASVARMQEDIRDLSRDLIERVRPRGGCDFFTAIAQHFPIAIFLRMANLPFEDRFDLMAIADMITHDPTPGAHAEGLRRLSSYLRGPLLDRRRKPGDDLLSILAAAQFDGAYPPEEEILYLATNVVLGGLDTVVSGLSSIMGYLARNPQQYQLLVSNPSGIKGAVEELLRVFGVAALERCVMHDLEFHGVELKKYDRFVIIPALYNVDPEAVTDPLSVDFDRTSRSHMSFGAGPHHCAGAHLARLEMRIFLEEWTRAIPEFGLEPGAVIESVGGFVLQPVAVPLRWDPATTRSSLPTSSVTAS